MRYRVMWTVRQRGEVVLRRGDELEMGEGEAEAWNRDSPGVLEEIKAKVEERIVEGAKDRMVRKGAGQRRGKKV